jgi:hypothetical protein
MRQKLTIFISIIILCVSMIGVGSAQQPPPPPTPSGGGGGGNGGGGNDQPAEFDPNYQAVASTYSGIGTITMGEGEEVNNFSLTTECSTGDRFVSGATGLVVADDGSEWLVPMQTTKDGAGSIDLFNSCSGSGANPNALDQLETVVIDPDGEVITAYIFADNYFELYVNGVYVARDNINFVPFNSSVVRFQASYPMTIAVQMADWEDHYGLGMEYDSYHVGDAGFIAYFDNGVVTNDEWKVLPVYIAPLDDPACVVEDEFGNPDSSACSIQPECSTMNAAVCRALHYPIPDDWTTPEFDDSNWLPASLYEANRVTNQAAYVDYANVFGDAQFIWSSNLNLDDQVLARYTVEAAPTN